MDIKSVLDAIRKGVEFIETLAPVISVIPGAGPILAQAVKAAGAVQAIIANLQERVAEGKVVLASADEAEVRALAERLAAVNDRLAEEVDKS